MKFSMGMMGLKYRWYQTILKIPNEKSETIIRGRDNSIAKWKRTNRQQLSTNNTQKTKDWTTRTTLKAVNEPGVPEGWAVLVH